MPGREFFHEGMRALQDRYDGRRTANALEKHRLHGDFWPEERAMIEAASFFFIASAHDGHVDCSIKCGDPGFVKIVGPGTLEYPEYDGNSMYRTAGNILRSPQVGLLFVGFDGGRRIRLNGRAEILDDAEALARHHGAKFVVRVAGDLFPNCPRYIPDLAAGTPSPHPPRAGQPPPPAPEWKSRDYLIGTLPKDDPHFPQD